MEMRVTRLETQYERIASDIESEKRTRAEANATLSHKLDRVHEHMSKQDKMLYAGIGVLAALQFIAPYFIKK